MEISVEKLGELQPEDCVICDIRGEHDRAYGFIPGSVGISAEELLTSPPADGKKLIIYCARGIVSVDLADELCGRGLEAYSLEGGYIAWLRAEIVRRFPEQVVAASWSHLTVRGESSGDENVENSMVSLDMSNPLKFTESLCSEAFEHVHTASGIVESLR